jgi:hypothetical protein
MLAPILALPTIPATWPLPALAPALGAVGLAGAWPALAANARTAHRRAALAATGWIWIQLMTPLAGKSLYTKAAILPPRHWIHSTSATATHVLSPLLTGGMLAAALIWAAAAAILPLIRIGRPVAAGLAALTAWAIALTISTTIAGPPILAGEAALGAVAAFVFTLAPDVTKRVLQPDATRRLA